MQSLTSHPFKILLLLGLLALGACQPHSVSHPTPAASPSPVATVPADPATVTAPTPASVSPIVDDPEPVTPVVVSPAANPEPVVMPAREQPVLNSSSPPPVPSVSTQVPTGRGTKNSPDKSAINPIFKPVLSQLETQSQVPVVLPNYVPGGSEELPVYAKVESAATSGYSVILGYTPDCNGGTACRLGTLTAAKPSEPPTGETVTLAQGVTGYFTPATCGANCSDATLSWEQNGNRYTVGLKAGQKEALIEMANSAIAP